MIVFVHLRTRNTLVLGTVRLIERSEQIFGDLGRKDKETLRDFAEYLVKHRTPL